jgi:hypothetical protein
MKEDQFSRILQFFKVRYVPYQWFFHCLLCSSGWAANISKDLYVQLMFFLAQYREKGIPTSLQNFPLFKFVNDDN